MHKSYRNEQKIFIPGPSGRLEAQVMGILPDLASEKPLEVTEQISCDREIPTVGIICHPHPLYQGSMHNKVVTTIVRAWQAKGIATIRFNFRGVGESEGTYGNEIGEVEDLKAVIYWLIQQKLQHSDANAEAKRFQLCLAGFSFGSLISAKVAADMCAENSLSKHSSQTKPTESASEVENIYKKLRPRFLLSIAPVVNHFQLLENKLPTCPWLIIQGEKDELTDTKEVKHWFDKVRESHVKQKVEFITIPEASHFFHGKLIQLQKEIEEGTCVLLDSD